MTVPVSPLPDGLPAAPPSGLTSGLTSGLIRLLRAEGLAIFAGCALAYGALGESWTLAAILFLAPDLSMLFYLAGPRIGAAGYNAVHSYVTAVALGAGTLLSGSPLPLALALILGAHIGLDRALGYGLKEARGFRHTHLGPIGRG